MAIVLFDNQFRKKLYPLVLTRAVAGLRYGILTIKDRWQLKTRQEIFIQTEDYLQDLYAELPAGDHIWIDAAVVADPILTDRILSLQTGEALADEKGLIAGRSNKLNKSFDIKNSLQLFDEVFDMGSIQRLDYPWQLFQWNDAMLRLDFELLTKNNISQSISHSNQVVHAAGIYIEEGASVDFATLNSSSGPIYIGRNAVVQEGAMIRGPFALGENSLVKMGAKIYGATTIGPWCSAGGEIKNSIIMGYSNKAHDGYLGDTVMGEWCNLGAGTSNSNVKNTGGDVKMWDHFSKEYISAGQKCGMIMGDYSRAAINSSINTGSVIGVCANVFGNGLLPLVIKNFSWGIESKYQFDKAVRDILNWKKMKQRDISVAETKMLAHIFEQIP